MKNKKLILGLVGEIASGKDTMAEYLEKKYSAKTFSFSQPLRDILDIIYLPQTRKNLSDCGIALREMFGQDLLSKVIAEKVKQELAKIVTLPNVRLASDIDYLKNEPGFLLVNIETDPKIRFERLKKRGQNVDDKTKTWTEFKKDAEMKTEIQIRELAKQCKFSLNNNGTKKEFYQQIDQLIKEIN